MSNTQRSAGWATELADGAYKYIESMDQVVHNVKCAVGGALPLHNVHCLLAHDIDELLIKVRQCQCM